MYTQPFKKGDRICGFVDAYYRYTESKDDMIVNGHRLELDTKDFRDQIAEGDMIILECTSESRPAGYPFTPGSYLNGLWRPVFE